MRRDVTRAILLFRSKNRKRVKSFAVLQNQSDGDMCYEWCVRETSQERTDRVISHGFSRLHSARHQTEKVSLDSCGFHLKTIEPLQSRHTHTKLSTFRPSRKASPSGKKKNCVCVCQSFCVVSFCPKSFSRNQHSKETQDSDRAPE